MRRGMCLLGVALLGTGCQNRTVTEQARQIELLTAENRALKAKVERQAAEIQRLAETAQAAPVESSPRPAGSKEPFLRVEDTPAYRNLSQSLDESNKLLAQLQPRVKALEEQIQVTTAENQKLAAAQNELAAQLESAQASLEAAKKEVQAREARLAEFEANLRKLRSETAAQSQKSAQIARVLREIEEIERRRDAAANSILGRYRDVTEQFRNLAVGLDGQRGTEGVVNTPVDLSRIQQLMALADEDLRNLRSLSAQAAQAQRRLTAALK